MGVKSYKPVTHSRRFITNSDFSEITATKPEKSLLRPIHRTGGRNHHGFGTTRFRGGGHKRMYRVVDFRRDKDNIPADVLSIEYDPNRTARIALLQYQDGEKRYILAPQELKPGMQVVSGERVEPKVGNCMEMRNIPLGLTVHNIEVIPGKGGQMVRSAGMGAQLSAKEGDHVHLILPSGEIRKVHCRCRGTIGVLSNADHSNETIGKAGRQRWLGRRPHVRGKAMNPVDHPLGGGEGRSNGGRHPCSPTGVPAKGGKTRKRSKHSDSLIVQKRKAR